MDSHAILARFKSERQILAAMSHPGIAKIFDGGLTDSGLPFYVMELFPGVPITRYCAQQKLKMWDRVVLFRSVAQAVQHAHIKGIVHRDLKPANVLARRSRGTGEHRIAVIDFGISKLLNSDIGPRSIMTETGQLIGTPEYMSPEQAKGADVDTRSDIYSLGVLLYEMMTGVRPFNFTSTPLMEVLRCISEQRPLDPSSRIKTSKAETPDPAVNDTLEALGLSSDRYARELRRGLGSVIMKCLEKDRENRYQSVTGLIEDLEAVSRGDVPLSATNSTRNRASRFLADHRTPIAIGLNTIGGYMVINQLLAIAMHISGAPNPVRSAVGSIISYAMIVSLAPISVSLRVVRRRRIGLWDWFILVACSLLVLVFLLVAILIWSRGDSFSARFGSTG
jgi:serine/threonine protein kinase